MDNYNDNYEKLIAILEEIFQLNQADLDFGIYRIMNQKSEEIKDFLQNKLIPQVKEIIQGASMGNADDVKKELDNLIAQQEQLGLPKDVIYQIPKVKELQVKYEKTPSSTGLENEVFSHLTNFFKRYYDKGDFISMRRYKKDVYAIPYEGEEVKLHWANHDQYYIKTSEFLKNYAFKLAIGKSVRFQLTEAGAEKDNNKASNGKERQFRIAEKEALKIEGNTMTIFFTYLPSEKKEKREDINAHTFETIISQLPTDWVADVLHKVPTAKNADRTLLEKHINDFTARNTFDYFIHKDLGGFLTRELDFYIKNEVLHLNDIDIKNVDAYRQQLIKLDAIRKIGHKIILFLEQLENFQKKLWLKKKFVVETNYCITLDKIPESYYEEICANDAQWKEWEQLFFISELPKDLFNGGGDSDRNTILKDQSFLVLDTRFFSQDFKDRLLGEFEDLDEQTDGLLISSENFQALNLLQNKHQSQIDCVYIDPPYNTDATPILYKNEFKDSSWLALMENRINLSQKIGNEDSIICVTIDDYEFDKLKFLLNQVVAPSHHLGTALIRNNPQGRSTTKGFSVNHEFALFYSLFNENKGVGRLERNAKQKARYNEVDEFGVKFLWENFRKTGTDSNRNDRKKQFYPIYFNEIENRLRIPEMEWDKEKEVWTILEEAKTDDIVFLPLNELGEEKVWKWGADRVLKNPTHIKIGKGQKGQLQIFRRNYPNTNGKLPGTWWENSKYAAGEHGTNLLTDLFGKGHSFPFPKSVFAVMDCLVVCGGKTGEFILDYFAGSGTTGHAVINLNREDNGKRKYILVEMGEYFNTVTKPRIQKVIYSDGWKDGKPTTRNGSSHIFKYVRLEGYEDTLNNLRLVSQGDTGKMFGDNPNFHEDYMLGYMLDFESRESLLNVGNFDKPFDYTLSITTNNESQDQKVDMVETFNYLLGLKVKHTWTEDGFKVVSGESRKGESILVIWRNLADKNDEVLTTFCQSKEWHKKDNGFDTIYINGSNTLESFKEKGAKWKSQLIETTFHQLMFDTKDV